MVEAAGAEPSGTYVLGRTNLAAPDTADAIALAAAWAPHGLFSPAAQGCEGRVLCSSCTHSAGVRFPECAWEWRILRQAKRFHTNHGETADTCGR